MQSPSASPHQLDLLLELAACDQELEQIREQRRALDADLLPLTARLSRIEATLAYERGLLERTISALAQPVPRARPAEGRRQIAGALSLEQCRSSDLQRLAQIAHEIREQKQHAAAEANHRAALRTRAANTRHRITAHRREAQTLTRQIEAASPELEAARSELRRRADKARRQRAQLVAQLDPELLGRYESLDSPRRLATAVDGACSNCHVRLPRTTGSVDAPAAVANANQPRVAVCPGCGQLVYIPSRTKHH